MTFSTAPAVLVVESRDFRGEPCPKPAPRERKPFDYDAWRAAGACAYAERREVELMVRLVEDPNYKLLGDNPQRLKKLREEQFAVASGYHKHTMEQPCAACGSYDPELRSDPAHVGKTRGAGGKSDRVLPLCRFCHIWEEQNDGSFEEAFKDRHGVTPEEMAAARHEAYHRDHANRGSIAEMGSHA